MNKRNITYEEINRAAGYLANLIISAEKHRGEHREPTIYGVPRGGIFAALAVKGAMGLEACRITENVTEADYIIDDIIESGATAMRLRQPHQMFLGLFRRETAPFLPGIEFGNEVKTGDWLVFPWEKHQQETPDESIVSTLKARLQVYDATSLANDNISFYLSEGEKAMLQDEVERRCQSLLDALLIDTANDHNTKGTAHRMAKMFLTETFAGRYDAPPRLTTFPNAKKLDELYTTGPITVRSTCSHHFAPIFGRCWIGVIPGDTVIGLSKFNRIVDWIMSRPQIQEEAAVMLADFLEEVIKPKGLAIVIKATHTCMTMRGVKESHDAEMVTSVMRGLMMDNPAARAEFLTLIGK